MLGLLDRKQNCNRQSCCRALDVSFFFFFKANIDFCSSAFKAEGCPGGDSPTALGVTPRKRLHSAEDARCSSRPAPEGAGSVPLSESETGRRGEEKGRSLRCQQCQVKVAELKKQALSWADPCSLKVCGKTIIELAFVINSLALRQSVCSFIYPCK